MPAAPLNLVIEQGADWQPLPYTWNQASGQPHDLTGWTAKMQIRYRPGDTVQLELTTENGGIALGGVNGTIVLFATAAQTQVLDFSTAARYDLVLKSPGGSVVRLLKGTISLDRAITV